jgi:hypothetical protein
LFVIKSYLTAQSVYSNYGKNYSEVYLEEPEEQKIDLGIRHTAHETRNAKRETLKHMNGLPAVGKTLLVSGRGVRFILHTLFPCVMQFNIKRSYPGTNLSG